jgi:hypothetical protein
VTTKKSKTKGKVINLLITMLFLLGVVLTTFNIYIYHKTFISWTVPVTIYLSISLFATLLTSKSWDKYFIKTHFSLKLFYNTLSIGSIFCYLFLSLNYYNKDLSVKINRYAFEGKSEIRSKGQSSTNLPIANIKQISGSKELIFNYSEKYSVINCDTIELTLRKGLFGFVVIDKYEFIEQKRKNYR